MNLKKNLSPIVFAMVLIVLAAVSRFIPHPFNFTAIGAMAMFSGANIRNKNVALLLPLTVMVITDLFFGFHFSILPVYACLVFIVMIGFNIKKKQSARNILFGSLLSSIIFYLITNLPFWYADMSLYPLTLAGTLASYTAGLEFFRNQILGDLFYNLLLFGSFHLIFTKNRIFQTEKIKN